MDHNELSSPESMFKYMNIDTMKSYDDRKVNHIVYGANITPYTDSGSFVEETAKKIEEFTTSINIFRKNRNGVNLNSMQSDLDKIFYESKCKDMIYTVNTDKQFFGINVYPIIDISKVFNYLNGTMKYSAKEYYVEIDSKLMDSSLTDREIAICIVHDISGMCVENPMKKVKEIIDIYLAKTNSILMKTDSKRYMGLLTYGVRDCMRKVTSMFDIGDANIGMENDLIRVMNYTGYINDALIKLRNEGKISTASYESPIVILSWVLRLYNDILKHRVPAQAEIKEAIKFTASVLDKKELESLLKRINLIDDDVVLTESVLTDAIKDFKISGLKGYEDDYYEIKFAANNIETQDDALLLISKINSRMSVIADYLTSEKGIPSSQYKRWKTLLDNFNALRLEIANTKVRIANTRLYVNYGFD